MFIAIIGTRFAGKSTVQRYLVNVEGFTPVQVSRDLSDKVAAISFITRSPKRLTKATLQAHRRESFDEQTIHDRSQSDPGSTSSLEGGVTLSISSLGGNSHRVSFLSMVSPVSPDVSSPAQNEKQHRPMVFQSTAALLLHVTKNWRTNFVTLDLHTLDELTEFMTRPFVLVVSVDAPLLERYRRSLEWLVYQSAVFPPVVLTIRPGQTTTTLWKILSGNMIPSTTAPTIGNLAKLPPSFSNRSGEDSHLPPLSVA